MNTFKHWKQSVKLAQYEAFICTYKWEIHLIGIHWFTHKFITVVVILRSLEFDNYVGFTYGGDEQWERIFRRSYWWDASHVQKTIRAVFFYTFSLLSMYVQLYVCTTLCIRMYNSMYVHCTTLCMCTTLWMNLNEKHWYLKNILLALNSWEMQVLLTVTIRNVYILF